MSSLIKSDVEDLAFQQRGVLINTNTTAYEEFVRRRAFLENKNMEISVLNDKINNVQNQLSVIMEILQTLKRDDK